MEYLRKKLEGVGPKFQDIKKRTQEKYEDLKNSIKDKGEQLILPTKNNENSRAEQ